MSEKRSWDIQPKARQPAQPTPAPQPVRAPAPKPMQRPQKVAPPRKASKPKPSQEESNEAIPHARPMVTRGRVPQGRDREPLKERRRRARRRATWITLILFLIIAAAAVGFFWLPFVRIQKVDAAGPDSDGMQTITSSALLGNIDYIFPRNSIFLFPENVIRQNILTQYPDISAVSISRSALDGIAVTSIPREAALTWCGTTYTPGTHASPVVPVKISTKTASSTATTTIATEPAIITPTCYSADANGVIFAPITGDNPPSSETLTLYGALTNASADTSTDGTNTTKLGSVIADANMIPNALEFVKALKSLGAPIVTLVLRGDEADLYTQAGTRITYVLGQEHDAAQLAESAFPSLDLTNGSLEYIDLRFEGKVYFKKVGATSQASSTSSTQ